MHFRTKLFVAVSLLPRAAVAGLSIWTLFSAVSFVNLRAAPVTLLQEKNFFNHSTDATQDLPDGLAAVVVPSQTTPWGPTYAALVVKVTRVDAEAGDVDFSLGVNYKVRDVDAFKADLADASSVGVYPNITNSLFFSDVTYNDSSLARSTFVNLAQGESKVVTIYTYIGHPDKLLPSGTPLALAAYPQVLADASVVAKIKVSVLGKASQPGAALIASTNGVVEGYDMAMHLIARVPSQSAAEPPPRLDFKRERDAIVFSRPVRFPGYELVQNPYDLTNSVAWASVSAPTFVGWPDGTDLLKDQTLSIRVPTKDKPSMAFRLEERPLYIVSPLK